MVGRRSVLIGLFVVAAFGAGARAQEPAAEKQHSEAVARALAERWGARLVPVAFELRKVDGEDPHGPLNSPWQEDRPFVTAGLLVDATEVWVPDLGFDLRFVLGVAVGEPGRRVPARLDGHFLAAPGWRIASEIPIAGVERIAFLPAAEVGAADRLLAVGLDLGRRGWSVTVERVGAQWFRAGAAQHVRTPIGSLLVRANGDAAGFAFAEQICLDREQFFVWKGSEVMASPVLSAEELDRRGEELVARARRLAPTVEVRLRAVEDASGARFAPHMRAMGLENGDNQRQEGALAVGPRHLLVDWALEREDAARIERIRVLLPDEEREARFAGAFQEFGAFLIEIEGEDLPAHVDLARETEFSYGLPVILVASDHATGARREYVELNRVAGIAYAYREVKEPLLMRFQRRGALVHSALDDSLLGAVLEVRHHKPQGTRWARSAGLDLRVLTLRQLAELVREPEGKFDRTLLPLSEARAKDIVWLGVEYQPIDRELAKARGAENATRGGEIGLLVNWVHPESPAGVQGLVVGDILLGLRAKNETEERELNGDSDEDFGDFGSWDQLDVDEIPEEYLDELPPPWRSVRNGLNLELTRIGAGTEVELRYLRDGKEQVARFALSVAPPDFENAPKKEIAELGLTVKDLTYEVRAHNRVGAEAPGVVVARVEGGKKAAVARLLPYELITEVNATEVRSAEEFSAAIEAARAADAAGSVASLELSVRRLGKSRIIRLTLD